MTARRSTGTVGRRVDVSAVLALACLAPVALAATGASAGAQQPAQPAAPATAGAPATQRARVVGRVTDAATRAPVVNATVSIAGTAYQVSTGEDGAYVIANAPAGVFDIEVRRIGFALGRRDNVRLTAGQATTIDFALSSAPLRLQEVLVSASTESEQKVKMAYSAAKITAADLPVPPNFSAAGAIQGKVAGAQVGRARGPGAGTFVQLRTPTSQFNANSPLYIVDGVVLSSQISGTTLDVDNLDIASIEVIQGAVGATLYGARGANGVIQITTNRGRNIPLGATRFSVRSEYGRNELQRDLPRQRAHNFRVNAQGQYVNAQGQVVPRTQRVVDPVGIMDKAYVDPLFSSTATMLPGGNFLTNNVTLEGNSASTNFTANYSQYSEQGIIRDNGGFRRQNVRVNLDHRVRDVLQLSSSASYARQRDQGWLISFRDLYRINPDVDITARNADGSVVVVPDSTQIQRVNPFYRQIFTDSYTDGGRVMLSSQARYTPRSWLSLDANASFDRADRTPITFEPAGVPNGNAIDQPALGLFRQGENTNQTFNLQLGATATRQFGGLTSRFTVRGWSERETFDSVGTTAQQFTVTGVRNLNAAAVQAVSSQFIDIRSDRVQGAVNLDYRDKLILDGAFTRDASSLFGSEARWNNFYRLGAVYRVSEESWFPWKGVFDNLGVRYALGQAGSRPSFADQYEVLGIGTGGSLTRQDMGNRFLRPEITTEHEIGLDAIVKGRFSAQVAYVMRETKDNIIAMPTPGLTGFNTQNQNVGSIVGRSIEATLQAQLLKLGRFSWDANLVLDRPRNRITAFNRSCFTDGVLNRCDGTRLNTMWGQSFVRSAAQLPAVHANSQNAFQLNDDGFLVPVGAGNSYTDGLSKNLWTTNVTIDGRQYPWGRPMLQLAADGTALYTQIGDGNPELNYGLQNTFRYGRFRLYGLVNGQLGGDIYNAARQQMYADGSHADLDQSGKPEERRKPATYYSSGTGVARANTLWLDAFVEDATYAKLSELSLAYQLPGTLRFLQRFGADRLQLEVTGRNLLVLTNYSGNDPEARSGANTRVDNMTYPFYRTVTTAVNIAF